MWWRFSPERPVNGRSETAQVRNAVNSPDVRNALNDPRFGQADAAARSPLTLRKEIRVRQQRVYDLRSSLLDPRFSQAWGTNLNSNIVSGAAVQAGPAGAWGKNLNSPIVGGVDLRTSSFGQVWGHNLNSSIVDGATIRF